MELNPDRRDLNRKYDEILRRYARDKGRRDLDDLDSEALHRLERQVDDIIENYEAALFAYAGSPEDKTAYLTEKMRLSAPLMALLAEHHEIAQRVSGAQDEEEG